MTKRASKAENLFFLLLFQRNDIAMAITKFDQFDFLIDIVPRDELKPPKRQVRQKGCPVGCPFHGLFSYSLLGSWSGRTEPQI